MGYRRIQRLNSLLKEVISDVIQKEMKNPNLPEFITVTHTDITRDFRHAKVYISVIGNEKKKQEALSVLQSAAGFISLHASKQVVVHHFPELVFLIDESVEKQMRIEELLQQIHEEKKTRESDEG